jgi:DNA-binding transcriptional MocR family regulator
MPLGEGQSEEAFVTHARVQGVAVAPGASFVISGSAAGKTRSAAARISIGSTTLDELRSGLKVIANLRLSDPEPALLAI